MIFKQFCIFISGCIFLLFFLYNAASQDRVPMQTVLAEEWKLEDIPGERLNNPQSIRVSITGHIYIVDTGNERVIQLNHKGKYVNQVGGFGWGEQQFDSPRDVATRDGLNIFIADFNNQRIQRFNKELQRISTLGSSSVSQYSFTQKQSNELDIGRPVSIAISPLGDLFYINQDKNEIVKINSSGQHELTFGGFRSGERCLNPTRVRVSQKYVFIADVHRIMVYDHYGNYLSNIGSDVIKKASDMVPDNQDRLFVSDEDRKCIYVFSVRGELLETLFQYSFSKPTALDLYQNHLYVLDSDFCAVFVITITESRD
jgi:DNA-binding beta-propeller fold protein YncE